MSSLNPEKRPEVIDEITREQQPNQIESVITFEDEAEDFSGYVAFITGHMLDKSDRKTPRFPEQNYDKVRIALRSALDQAHLNRPIEKIVCSGTAGADLIAVEWALDHNVSVALYLPYDEHSFLNEAVGFSEQLSEAMLAIFERVKQDKNSRIFVPNLANGDPATLNSVIEASRQKGDVYRHYADLNRYMVGKLKPEDLVVAVWDGKGGDSPGGTEHAVRTALAEGAKISILNEGIENIAVSYPDLG